MSPKKKTDSSIVIIALIIGGLIIIAKILLFLLLISLIGFGIYRYFKWQKKKLIEYNNNWKLFFQKELKNKLIIFSMVTPIILSVGIYSYDKHKKEEQAKEELRIAEKRKENDERRKNLRILNAKKDSSQKYYDLSIIDLENKKYKHSLILLDSSLLTYSQNYKAQFQKAIVYKARRKYKEAIDECDILIDRTKKYNSEAYLLKGQCLLKLRKKEEAVLALYKATKLNNEEAMVLYEKYNPIIKKFDGYVTRCCDGTTSYSTGGGTCSSHGGVCKWNERTYRKERKYLIK